MTDKHYTPHVWCEAWAETGVGRVDFYICSRCGKLFPGPIDECPSDEYLGGCQ
ncbi:unnamed protein product [marine sediment metagenome]|uniref:Uncharacterized protein n=1 Tax=marine sediment metagenome TaxID=412755 RepID=X0Z070_9ZZZZ